MRILALILLLTAISSAQVDRSSIAGTVLDPSGESDPEGSYPGYQRNGWKSGKRRQRRRARLSSPIWR